MYSFGEIKPLKVAYQNQFHFTIDTTHLGTLKKKTHYFPTIEDAASWREWAKGITEKPLPLGVTVDLRNRAKPFLARFKVPGAHGKRHTAYHENLGDAIRWLNERKVQATT